MRMSLDQLVEARMVSPRFRRRVQVPVRLAPSKSRRARRLERAEALTVRVERNIKRNGGRQLTGLI